MATEIRPELAARIAEMDAITERYLVLDVYDEPSIKSRQETMSALYGDFDRIAEGAVEDKNIPLLADDHVRLLEMLNGKPEQQELAYYIGDAMGASASYKEAVEQRAAALSSSFGWSLPADQFQLTIEAALKIQERNIMAKEDRKTADFDLSLADAELVSLDPELAALAAQLDAESGLEAIRSRAKAYSNSVHELGLEKAKAGITLDVARDWVAADVRDFHVIEERGQIHEAAAVMLVNAGKVGLYGEELKTSEPTLSAELKGMAAEFDQESPIKQRDVTEGKPSSAEEARIRANEDALDIVLGCDTSDQGLAVVSRNMNNKDYRESFKEAVSEFVALNEDGPFYDAQRFWAAQRIIQVSDRKEFLRQGGEPELSDWAILLAEVLQKQRRPLSGAEFKELVTALEGAARNANTQKTEIHQVVGLLAKVHGSSGESLFRDNELRGAYRDGLREQSGTGLQAVKPDSPAAADVSQEAKKRPTTAMRA